MKKLKKWAKDKIAIMSISLANVEKDLLNNRGTEISNEVNHVSRNTKGQLCDSLINGEVTKEVMDLRWRMYKILKEDENKKEVIIGYDKDNKPIFGNKIANKNVLLSKIKIDDKDNFPLELSIENKEISINLIESVEKLFAYNETEINDIEHKSLFKSEKTIKINRDFFTKFKIENFTEKINIRTIDNELKLLEFYISKYEDDEEINRNIFLKEVKKIIEKNLHSSQFDFNSLEFITFNNVGVADNLYFKYDMISFDKIITFNGYYVIKFKVKTVENGVDVIEKFRMEDLDKKYENKERK